MDEKKIEALEKQVQELRKMVKDQEQRGLLNSISCILLGCSITIGFWQIYGHLIRISEWIREILNLDTSILQQIGDLTACISELFQKSNLF